MGSSVASMLGSKLDLVELRDLSLGYGCVLGLSVVTGATLHVWLFESSALLDCGRWIALRHCRESAARGGPFLALVTVLVVILGVIKAWLQTE